MNDHISVCVCTVRRNAMLARLLRSLAVQETRGLFTFSAVVVDNDPAGAAREVVDRLADEFRMETVYGIEPERSIPAARNRALRLAKGNFIGIIDDDEFPPPRWLATLYEAVRKYGVDGALGPVFPHFDEAAPAWLVGSGLCDYPLRRTGTILPWNETFTGNVLIKKDVIDRLGIRFDERFRTGGSDQDFFKRAMEKGCRFVAVEEAPVHETVPPQRWSRRYFVRRALVNGYNAQKYRSDRPDPLQSVASSARSFATFSVYALALPVCAGLGSRPLMTCLEGGAYHLSRLAAGLGIELWKRRDF